MNSASAHPETAVLPVLLRGDPAALRAWTERSYAIRGLACVAVILAGAGLYGYTMGVWRAPLQGLYVGLKFPLIILLTTLGNTLLNAMLAPLLGLNISLRQSFMAILMSFSITSAILGAFAPILGFLVWSLPPFSPELARSGGTYSFIMVTHVAVIAFAGIVGNLRLAKLLGAYSGSTQVTQRVLLAWLAGNLLLGSQLSWIMRPFIGSPSLAVQFLRHEAFHGNFYEAVFNSVLRVLNP